MDRPSLAGAVVAMALWAITHNPLLSVITVTVIYAMGYITTIRKSWLRAHTERLGTHYLSAIRCFVSLFALAQFTLVTALYPFALFVMNFAFAAMLTLCREQRARAQIVDPAYALD